MKIQKYDRKFPELAEKMKIPLGNMKIWKFENVMESFQKLSEKVKKWNFTILFSKFAFKKKVKFHYFFKQIC